MYIITVYHQNLSKIYHSYLKAYFDSNVKHITCYLNLLTSCELRANTFFYIYFQVINYSWRGGGRGGGGDLQG